jgi:hypothetical protein
MGNAKVKRYLWYWGIVAKIGYICGDGNGNGNGTVGILAGRIGQSRKNKLYVKGVKKTKVKVTVTVNLKG